MRISNKYLKMSMAVVACSLLAGSVATAAIINEDFNSGSIVTTSPSSGPEASNMTANYDQWLARSGGGRWGVDVGDNNIAERVATYDNGNWGMVFFTEDSTTGALDFSFDYRLKGGAGQEPHEPQLRWTVWAINTTGWTGRIGYDNANGENSLANSLDTYNPTEVVELGSGLLNSEQTTFASVNPTISDAPVGTVAFAVRFDSWNTDTDFGDEYVQIDNVLLATAIPEPGSFVLAAIGLLVFVGLRRRK